MSKNITKLITFSETMWEKILELQEKHGLLSPADAVRYSITIATGKKTYEEKEERIRSIQKLTPLEKATAELDAQQAKQEAKRASQEAICTTLEGMIDGQGFCNYIRYELPQSPKLPVEGSAINCPVMDLHPVDIKEQWRGKDGLATDKALVQAHIKKYGLNTY